MIDLGRRSFFKRFAAATAGAMALGVSANGSGLVDLVDPERELWVPGAKTIIDLHTPTVLRPDADADLFARTMARAPEGRYAFVRDTPVLPVDAFRPRQETDRFYSPDRYRVSTSDGIDLHFDSDWKLQRAIDVTNVSRHMTMEEQRALAKQMFDPQPVKKYTSAFPYVNKYRRG